jgi:hypothetical protein
MSETRCLKKKESTKMREFTLYFDFQILVSLFQLISST